MRRNDAMQIAFCIPLILLAVTVDLGWAAPAGRCRVCEELKSNLNYEMKRLDQKMDHELKNIDRKLDWLLSGDACLGRVMPNCAELYNCGQRTNGVYHIDPDDQGSIEVYCDQTTAGGGWTVFQKRIDGSVDFYRNWSDYKQGFGDLHGEYWLGLDKINRLTNSARNRLRIDMEDSGGNISYAQYDFFAVASERTKYQLSLGNFTGPAGDSFSYHRARPFSTKDRDNDAHATTNCARSHKGAWWYGSCHGSNLNGVYYLGHHESYADGVNWKTFKGYKDSLRRTEMKIRPIDFSPAD